MNISNLYAHMLIEFYNGLKCVAQCTVNTTRVWWIPYTVELQLLPMQKLLAHDDVSRFEKPNERRHASI